MAVRIKSSEISPTILIDSREQTALPVTRFKTHVGALQSGDYSIVGAEAQFAVERKEISDAVGCCMGSNRERFERALHRLRGFRFKRLLIVGTEAEILNGQYRSNVQPAAVIHTLRAFEVRYDVPLVYCASVEAAAKQVESWVFWYAREIMRTAAELWHTMEGATL